MKRPTSSLFFLGNLCKPSCSAARMTSECFNISKKKTIYRSYENWNNCIVNFTFGHTWKHWQVVNAQMATFSSFYVIVSPLDHNTIVGPFWHCLFDAVCRFPTFINRIGLCKKQFGTLQRLKVNLKELFLTWTNRSQSSFADPGKSNWNRQEEFW